MYYCYLETPIGDLLLAGDEEALYLVGFPEGSMRREPEPDWIYSEKPFGDAREQLSAYFAGERKSFDLNLKPGGTEFQMQVLEELQKIPYGTTTSYGDIAKRIGAGPKRCGQLVPQTDAIRSRSSFPATGSSAAQAI